MAQDEQDLLANTRKFLKQLAEEGIKPNLDVILEIAGRDELPVLVYDPADEAKEDLMALGWKGDPVFAMSKSEAARTFRQVDPVTAPWIMRPRPIGGFHLLVFNGPGSLLVNWNPKQGFSLESGSTDREIQS